MPQFKIYLFHCIEPSHRLRIFENCFTNVFLDSNTIFENKIKEFIRLVSIPVGSFRKCLFETDIQYKNKFTFILNINLKSCDFTVLFIFTKRIWTITKRNNVCP